MTTITWKKEFKEHPIHNRLESIYKILNIEWSIAEESEPEKRLKLRKLINNIKISLNSIDVYLLTKEFIDSLDATISSIEPTILMYGKDGNLIHLDNTLKEIYTNGYYNFFTLPIAKKRNNKNNKDSSYDDEILTTINSLIKEKDTFNEHLTKLEDTSEKINEKLNKLNDEIESTKSESNNLTTSLNDLILKKKDEITNELNEFEELVKKETEDKVNAIILESTKTLNESQDKFNELTKSIKQESTELLEKQEENTGEILENFLEDKKKEIDKIYNEINDIKKDIEEKRKKVLELYNLVATDSVAGGYKQTYQDEKKIANWLRFTGMIFIGSAIAWAMMVFHLLTQQKAPSSILIELSNLSIIFLFISLGYYSTLQSEKHRNISIWAKKMSLEVEAFDPFISSLPESEQQTLKKNLAKKIFGEMLMNGDGYKNDKTGSIQMDTLHEFGKLLNNISKDK